MATAAAEMTNADVKKPSLFDKAYGYYRKRQDVAALNVLARMPNQEEARILELRAQVFYRQEKFSEALQLFTKLMRSHSDEFDELRRAIIVAVKARLLQQQTEKSGSKSSGPESAVETNELETFELQYNTASQLLSAGRNQEALKLLDTARVLCQETLEEEGMNSKEIAVEQAPLLAQRAFALQKLGSKKDALKQYQRVLKTKGIDTKVRESILSNMESDFVRYGKKFGLRKATEQMEVDGIKKRRRKRKPRMPRDFDPEKGPDPERWLPRQERAAYRKKLNKRMKEREVGRGTQGASAAASAAMDYSRGGSTPPSTSHPSPKPTPPIAGEGPRQQRPGQAKKQKKKGGRW